MERASLQNRPVLKPKREAPDPRERRKKEKGEEVAHIGQIVIPCLKQAKTCLPSSMLSSSTIVHVYQQIWGIKGCSVLRMFSK